MNPFTQYPWITLLISLVGAAVFLYLIDHFRAYVLDGSRDPVRVTSLRYMVFAVSLLTISLVGLILSLGSLMIRTLADQPAATAAADAVSNPYPGAAGTLTVVTPGPALLTPTPTLTPPPPSPTPSITAIIGNTGGAGANLRTIPGTTGTIITSVNDGTEVTVMGETETADGFSWQLIILPDGRQGWVVINYLIYSP